MAAITLRALRTCVLAVIGAECWVTTANGTIEGPLTRLEGQDWMKIDPPVSNCRVYIAIAGGFVEQDNVKKGSVLSANLCDRTAIHNASIQTIFENRPLGVIPFGDQPLPNEMTSEEFTVSLHSNRVGVRLEGPKFDAGPESLSEPACPGTIQVANSGDLIILGPDGPTIGGYRKIGVVCSADLDRVGQLRPGTRCTFAQLSKEEAVEQARKYHQDLNAMFGGTEV